jgi:hypothetical protein
MARLLKASWHLPRFPTRATFPPPALASAGYEKKAESSVLVGPSFSYI